MSEESAEGQAREVDYERFCTYAEREVLGVEVQGEYFYIVQPLKISVYQYYSEAKKPQLIEQLIYNKLILHYAINQHYICILTSAFVEVRDRLNWNRLLHTHPTPQPRNQPSMILSDHTLYLSTPGPVLSFQRIQIRDKQHKDTLQFGEVPKNNILTRLPLLITQLGSLEDYYCWCRSSHLLQMGLFYSNDARSKHRFQICLLDFQGFKIQSIFHHKVTSNQTHANPCKFLIVVVSHVNQLVVFFIDLLPRQLHRDGSNLQTVVQQMDYLSNFNRKITPQMLQSHEQSGLFWMSLDKMNSYQSSFLHEGHLWIISNDSVCYIQLLDKTTQEQLSRQYDSKQRFLIKSVDYQPKQIDKIGVGLYQDNLLFKEKTISYLVAFEKEITQSIAQEIDDQEIEEDKEVQELCQDIIDGAFQQQHQELMKTQTAPVLPSLMSHKSHYTFRHDKKSLYSKVYSETHHQLKEGTAEYAIQTQQPSKRIDDFESLQTLVAKYSSAVTVSCSRMRYNSTQRQKFERQIKSLVQNMGSTILQPFLQQRFIALLQEQVQKISFNISTVLLQELEVLNQTMRKIEIKENTLRGKKIYDFNQIMQQIKNSVEGVCDTLKQRQINKIATQQLIKEEAAAIRQQVQQIQDQIVAATTVKLTQEDQINQKIIEITALLGKMHQNEVKQEEDSEVENQSDQESSQGEEESVGSESEEEDSETEEQFRVAQHFHNYPESHSKVRSGKMSSRYPKQQGYFPEFVPPPPQYPYYYPYGPQGATLPYQPLYPPMHSYQPVPSAPKKAKKKKNI